jgi:hypothetical protein
VIRRGSEAQRRARGTPSRRQVTYVPYDPSFEMPDEGGPNERLTGDSIPRRVTPIQLAVSKPAQSPGRGEPSDSLFVPVTLTHSNLRRRKPRD